MFRSPKTGLAPGFRFHPTDEELVCYYLKRKISGKPLHVEAISEIDIYKSEPWDLPGQSRLKTRDLEWYFFCALDKKYMNGSRMNRATKKGYWKATGKDRPIRRGSRTVGMKKTLVFHTGRAPSGERTNWVMHEYRLEDTELGQAGAHLNMFVLCRIVQKSGFGPRNGERYGAPLDEEEWGDDDVLIPKVESGDDGDIDTASDVGERGYLQMDDGDQDNGDMKIIDVNRDPVELKMRHFERLMKNMEELREENRNLKISRQAIEELLEDRISGCIRKIEDLKNDRDRLELLEDRISEVLRKIEDLKRDKDHIEWKLFEGIDKVLSKELVMK